MSNLSASALVSVIVPAYNGEKTILNTLSSVVRQGYRTLELIIVDDASRDSTVLLIKDFCAKHNFDFKLLVHRKNMGLSRTLNDGIKEARGDFILILHQDCELVGDDWIEKAVKLMADESVAIVTGYYGIVASDDVNFIKRAFGVIRGQIHSRPSVSHEELTFSEGKCDLYRRDLLLKIGGFPTQYRIAGEDLIVSYRFRSMGYKIIKSYDLPVVQKFGGKAESFFGNLEKEFLFGKAMGGVFSEFKLFLFKNLHSSAYSRSRSVHRASQPLFIIILSALVVISSLSSMKILSFLVFGCLCARYMLYTKKVSAEIKRLKRPPLCFFEPFVIAFLGLLTDFVYTAGFIYGSLLWRLNKRL